MQLLNERTLSIKLKTLAAEAKIIRRDERKALRRARRLSIHKDAEGNNIGPWSQRHDPDSPKPEIPESLWGKVENQENIISEEYANYWGLRDHRIRILRRAARISHLALNFLRGTPYTEVEASCHENPDWDNVWKEILRFSPPTAKVNDTNKSILRESFMTWATLTEKPTLVKQ